MYENVSIHVYSIDMTHNVLQTWKESFWQSSRTCVDNTLQLFAGSSTLSCIQKMTWAKGSSNSKMKTRPPLWSPFFFESRWMCVCVGHESCASLGGNTLPLTRSQNAPLFLRHLDFMDTQSTALSHDRLVMCMPPTWENWVLTSTSAAWCRLPWSAASWAHPAGKK